MKYFIKFAALIVIVILNFDQPVNATSASKARAETCARLLASFGRRLQPSVSHALSTSHPNKQINITLIVPRDRAEDRSSSSRGSRYIPILTRMALLKIKLLESYPLSEATSSVTIRGNAKSLTQLFSDLEFQRNATQIDLIIWARLSSPPSPIDVTDLDQVKEVMDRLLYSDFSQFAGFQGMGIGKNSSGEYIIVVNIEEGSSGPTERLEKSESVEIKYKENQQASAL